MASYQNDFLKITEASGYYAEIQKWDLSADRAFMVDALSYFEGKNKTISEVRRYYYSKPKTKDVNGQSVTIGGGAVENTYVANFKIGYGIFKDVVSQKVNTLLDETPSIESEQVDVESVFSTAFRKQFGYALKIAGNKASAQGVGYIYEDYTGKLTVFDSENVIPYWDDITGELRALIRYWRVKYNDNNSEKTFFEVYEETQMTVYSYQDKPEVVTDTKPYKYKIIKDIDEQRIEGEGIRLPIIVLKNNEHMKSDLTDNLRSKIDAIDLVNSGFANNIADFSELIWVIKSYKGINAEELEDFVANINQTRKLVVNGDGADVDTKQATIPTEARRTFVDDRKREIVEETGVLDTTNFTGSSLTTTAIKAASMRLRQRVSEFEWQAYEAASNLIYLWQAYNNMSFEFDLVFTELLLQNDTEIIDNAVKMRSDISKKSLLTLYKRAGYIKSVDDEFIEIEKEGVSKFTLNDFGGVTDGQGTQGNGQTAETSTDGNQQEVSGTVQPTETQST